MKRLQILYYISHVNTWELLIYLMPVMSIFCIAIAHLKIFSYAKSVSKTSETKKVYWALRYMVTFNLITLLMISLRYIDLHEPPEKDLIFKKTKQISSNLF
jgi:hypothetical protein